jgi:hypothetical protein
MNRRFTTDEKSKDSGKFGKRSRFWMNVLGRFRRDSGIAYRQ